MAVAACPYELAGFHTDLVGYQVGQQGVGGDIEGYTQEHVGAALVQLTRQFLHAVRAFVHVKLEHGVAGRQCHLINLGGVPCRDNVAA